AQLEPPRSVDRIVRFLAGLSRSIASVGTDEGEIAGPIGAAGRSAARFGQAVAERTTIEPVYPPRSDWLTGLMARHQVGTADIGSFSAWLVRWNDKRAETEVLRAPETNLVRPRALTAGTGRDAGDASL